jgi:outer membrane protein assembly factor BamB
MRLFCILFLLSALSGLRAGDWPVFRGAERDGISREAGWKASDDAPIAWKAEVGLGYSAATVSNGKAIITGHDGAESDVVFCFDDETGEELWRFRYPQPKGDLYFQGGTTGTVTAEGDRLYHVAREGELFCLSAADGSVIWSRHLQNDLGYSKPTWGFTGAPLPHGDVLYVTAGEAGLALKKDDGSVVWKSEDEEAGYATPYLFGKDPELIIFTNKRFYNCVEAATGRKLWEYKWMTRYGVNAADPVVSGDDIFISSGYGKGAALLKWDGAGEPSTAWRSRDMKNQMNASILIDGYLYGVDGNESVDGTSLKCVEMATGKTLWTETSVGHGTVSVADNQLIVLTEMGELQVAPVSPGGYEPTFTRQVVKPKVWTVPVLANGRVYCRNAAGDLVVLDFSGD